MEGMLEVRMTEARKQLKKIIQDERVPMTENHYFMDTV